MVVTVRELIDILETLNQEHPNFEDYTVTIDEVLSIELDINHEEEKIILYKGDD